MLKIIELFAGVGSQTQALKNLGIEHEVVGVAEIDKYAIQSYEMLHGAVNNFGDVSKIESLPSADLWTYSFPCQDLSVAGKNEGIKEGTRSGLLFEVERLLEVSEKPKYLLMENVKNLVGKKHKPDFDRWCEKLKQIGYKNHWEVLNAKHCGVPQNRERVFMVSVLGGGEYKFPEKEELKIRLKDVLEHEVEEKYYLSEEVVKRFLKFDKAVGDDLLQIGTTDPNKTVGQRDRTYSVDGIAPCLSAMDYKQPKQILEPKIMQIGNVAVEKNFANPQTGRIYSQDGISPTLNTCGGGQREPKVLDSDFRIRKLTPRECWRLMGWSDEQFDKIKGISATQLYKQAGNGIVVTVLERIFENLLRRV